MAGWDVKPGTKRCRLWTAAPYGKARLRLHELITADRWGRAWTQTVSMPGPRGGFVREAGTNIAADRSLMDRITDLQAA